MKRRVIAAITAACTMAGAISPVQAATVRTSTYIPIEVRAAVWTSEGGQDDLRWYNAQLNQNGTDYICEFDMDDHPGYGTVNVHTYAFMDGTPILVGREEMWKEVPEAEPTFIANRHKNGLDVYAAGYKGYRNLVVAVWSDAGGQDDLTWYWLDSNGCANMEFAKHNDGSLIHLHLYGWNIKTGLQTFLAGEEC